MLVAGGMALIALAAWLARLTWPLLFAALPMLYRNPLELLWGLEAAAAMFALSLFILVVCLYMRDPAAPEVASLHNCIRAALGSHRVHRHIACRDCRLVRYRVVAPRAALAAPIRIG